MSSVAAMDDTSRNRVGSVNVYEHAFSSSSEMLVTGGFVDNHRAVVQRYLYVIQSAVQDSSITTLADDELDLKKPINLRLTWKEGEFIAEFPEAELMTSGETAQAAIEWMRDTVSSHYRLFTSERGALGPLPKRQLAVLEEFVGKKHTRTE